MMNCIVALISWTLAIGADGHVLCINGVCEVAPDPPVLVCRKPDDVFEVFAWTKDPATGEETWTRSGKVKLIPTSLQPTD